MKNVVFFFLFYFSYSISQTNDLENQKKDTLTNKKNIPTPFNPNGSYQTIAIKTRLLPWVLGDDKGYNALIGLEVGFFKNNSVTIDIIKNYSNHNLDAYYRNDSIIKPIRNRDISSNELHSAYNFYLNFKSIRDTIGLSFYTGINYRIGMQKLTSDTGMYVNDFTVSSDAKYFSFGPQVGVLYNIGKRNFLALNLNISTFYNIKNITIIETNALNTSNYNYTFKTVNFRIGLNLLFWFRYNKLYYKRREKVNLNERVRFS